MRRYAVFGEHREYLLRKLVVDDAFIYYGTAFCRVKRGRVVLELLYNEVRVIGFVKLLGLSFVDLLQLFHFKYRPS